MSLPFNEPKNTLPERPFLSRLVTVPGPRMQVFRGRIGSLRKGLKSRAEFFFVDAPHLAQGEEAEIIAAGGTGDHPRAWWTWEVKSANAYVSTLRTSTGNMLAFSLSERLRKSYFLVSGAC